ncbi:Glycerol-3-phosphate dehydrogenase [Sulfitobacter noctilucicola]|uniref:Uncharacterized protein n=1 Tax=Sulfitobacter noctilucicola TaxID=1342301 RepID=A0A7W6Q6W0_9RHOB|nr:hypothetical protein [Sulfitobacter noctilucicola]KIN63893.1 Glycerol-3-phosphate dehydrogenase [Sulfitobacter noctilucicola]MBB4175252.1 hypothetical protein [Sulfitobacter noctilucicola]
MSDPVTNAEVEDVLSSIRRLVSEDKRPVQAPKADLRNDRLVLTPALRVTTPNETPAEQASHDAVSAQSPDVAERSEMSISSLVSDDEAIDTYVPAHEDVDDSDPTEVSDMSATEDESLFDDPAQDYADDPYQFDDDDNIDGEEEISVHTSPDDYDFGGARDDANTERDLSEAVLLSAELKESEMHDAVSEGEIHAEGQSDDLHTEGAQRADMLADEEHVQTDDHAEAAKQDGQTDDTQAHVEKSAALTAKIAALETAIGQISDTWEPDEAGDGDYAGTEPDTMEWEDDTQSAEEFFRPPNDEADTLEGQNTKEVQDDHREAEGAARQNDGSDDQPMMAGAAGKPSDAKIDLGEEEQLLDEDALRDLISDIVRAELQGALGERITRNVRKLVRREIHRALTAQDLE